MLYTKDNSPKWAREFINSHKGFTKSIINRAICKTIENARGSETADQLYNRCQANFMALYDESAEILCLRKRKCS